MQQDNAAQKQSRIHSGASPEAIAHHYDVGTNFFSVWLDKNLVYSAARWDRTINPLETLEQAQDAKLDWHLNAVGAAPGKSVLDIGCGWGALLARATKRFGSASAVGLTLSEDQHLHVVGMNIREAAVRLESYEDHPLDRSYDGIVSIGAFEHFARPHINARAKVQIYENFFDRCRRWLKPGGQLSLQSICWGDADQLTRRDVLPEHVFPDSDLPFLHEIIAASHPYLEVLLVETSRDDYARTLAEWLRRLRAGRASILAMPGGSDLYEHYRAYLQQSLIGFRWNRITLARLILRRN
jgi:cyclopropane-fatty-acyl-phospholipid synthase